MSDEGLTQKAGEENVPTSLPTEGCQTCVDCGRQPPQTETNYTLISARHGWRLSRSVDPSGLRVMKWRCPDCWKKHRTTGK
jgi:hypothetical protein